MYIVLTIKQILKLDPELEALSEEELVELKDALYETADLAFDVWWLQRKGSKNPFGSLHGQVNVATV